MATLAQLIKLGVRLTPAPPTPPDYTVSNWTELNDLLTGPADLSGATVLVDGNCSGARISLSGKTWPGLLIRGVSSAAKSVMPRIGFNNCDGSAGDPITFRWLEFYESYGAAYNPSGNIPITSGIISFDSTTSSYITFDDCEFHDDDLSGKTMGYGIGVYRGFAESGSGKCDNLTVTSCYIYNVNRGMTVSGSDVLVEFCRIHDFYQNPIVNVGSNQTFRNNWSWNVWAAGSDPGLPHASCGPISPQPSGSSDMTDIIVQGCIALPGRARYDHDGQTPAASGMKFNDMFATGFRHRRIDVLNNLIVVADTQAFEIDVGTDCLVAWNTFAADTAQIGSNQPNFYVNDWVDIQSYGNICANISVGAQGWGSGNSFFNNLSANNTSTGATNLVTYANTFEGPSFGLISTPEDAIVVFGLNPAHPASSWSIKPGATNYYDFETGVESWPAVVAPSTTNVTSQTVSTVTKTNDVAVRSDPTGSNIAWIPSSPRVGGIIFRLQVGSAIDNTTRYAMTYHNTRCSIERLSGDNWRFLVENAAGSAILNATSNVACSSADGLVTLIIGFDFDQAKMSLVQLVNGDVQSDWPDITNFVSDDPGFSNAQNITVGYSNLSSTGFTTAWVDAIDLYAQTDDFLDMDDPAVFDAVVNTSGELAYLGVAGVDILGSTWAIWLQGNAAAWNGTGFNLGNGTGTGGAATQFAKIGSGSFS
jgi:hypothetical protein